MANEHAIKRIPYKYFNKWFKNNIRKPKKFKGKFILNIL